jgi:hypothetical protein
MIKRIGFFLCLLALITVLGCRGGGQGLRSGSPQFQAGAELQVAAIKADTRGCLK